MSDDTIVNETNVEPTVDVVVPEPQGETEDATDWKAEARKWEKRAKDANSYKDAADKWHNYEEAQKPVQERMAQELATTKAEAESARIALMRYEVASEKSIPTEAIRLLQGSTREELEENADALVALIATQSKPKTPTPDASQGRPATDAPGQLTKEDLASMSPSEIMAAKRAGRLSDVLGH